MYFHLSFIKFIQIVIIKILIIFNYFNQSIASVQIGDTLSLNQMLNTSSNGYVELTGNDGSIIHVYGGAQIKIEQNDENNKNVINYFNKDGNITVKSPKEKLISVNDNKLKLIENSTVSIDFDTGDDFNLVVPEGFIELNDKKYEKSFFKLNTSLKSISEILNSDNRKKIAKKYDVIFSNNYNNVNKYTVDDFDSDGRSFYMETNSDITDPKVYDTSSRAKPELSVNELYAYTKLYTLFNENILNQARDIKYLYVIDGVEKNISSTPKVLIITPNMIGKTIFSRIKYISTITNSVVNQDSPPLTVKNPFNTVNITKNIGQRVNLFKHIKYKYDPSIFDIKIIIKLYSSSGKREYVTDDNLYISAKYMNKPNATWWIKSTNKETNRINYKKIGDFKINIPAAPKVLGNKQGKAFFSTNLINGNDTLIRYATAIGKNISTVGNVSDIEGLRFQVKVVSTSKCFGDPFTSNYVYNISDIPQINKVVKTPEKGYLMGYCKTKYVNKPVGSVTVNLQNITVYNRYVDKNGDVVIADY